ncbi:hypothetical protein PGT21_000102 [Puccinia graminis f. sp. tritici]|uniref:Uncharacterized protein n=1 Tax=Puccinia graminis f. sp. tritici TaxID=56615 RepID=A0A5B0Q1R2_PUCGR|nr:hypothetical protein PGT21_000102 [Puccinia graminis f. sp. tritici]
MSTKDIHVILDLGNQVILARRGYRTIGRNLTPVFFTEAILPQIVENVDAVCSTEDDPGVLKKLPQSGLYEQEDRFDLWRTRLTPKTGQKVLEKKDSHID